VRVGSCHAGVMSGIVDRLCDEGDIELVLAARHGSSEAFAVLIDHYYSPIQTYFIHVIGEPTVAEELTQETFLTVYRALYRLHDARSFRAWLYRIARNHAMSYLRRRRLLKFVGLEQLGDAVGSLMGSRSSRPFVDTVSIREETEHILSLLTTNEREALLLHGVYGFTAKEVADILGISPHAAGRRISRAKAHFRMCYAEVSAIGEDAGAEGTPRSKS
jgi:RNA polymerase sigma-70 factor (ECF subfamily)